VRSDLFTTRSPAQTLITDFFGGVAQVEVLEEEVVAGLRVDEENRVHTEEATILPDSSQLARSPSHSRALQEQPQRGQLLFPTDPLSTSRSTSSDPGTGTGIDIGSEARAASALHQRRPLCCGSSQQQPHLLNDATIITSRDGGGGADILRAWCAIVGLVLLVVYSSIPQRPWIILEKAQDAIG
jgi:hypothetical protein